MIGHHSHPSQLYTLLTLPLLHGRKSISQTLIDYKFVASLIFTLTIQDTNQILTSFSHASKSILFHYSILNLIKVYLFQL